MDHPTRSSWLLEEYEEYALRYKKYQHVLEGYSDTNWIVDFEKSKSTSGYIFILGGTAISWKSSKQIWIAHSIIESKCIALDKAGEESK